MPKVTLPMADWDTLIYVLERAFVDGFLVAALISDIKEQVYAQES